MSGKEADRSGNSTNRRRAFADVVSIDAWHDRFDAKHPTVDLHADVVFGTARVGGEADSPIRFRLSVTREVTGLQLDLDLYAPEDKRHPQHRAMAIKGVRRQEERTALLLAEFLRNRGQAMHVIEKYGNDKADLTNAALGVLRTLWTQENSGKQFSDLQIARKVSGCFSKAEDKRPFVTYYFAKHLRLNSEMRDWLLNKSVSYLSKKQQAEFSEFIQSSYYNDYLGSSYYFTEQSPSRHRKKPDQLPFGSMGTRRKPKSSRPL